MVSKANGDSRDDKDDKDSRTNKDNNKDSRANKDNNKDSRDSKDNKDNSKDNKDNSKDNRDSKDNKGNSPTDRAAATNKRQTGKAIEPIGAAVRPRGMIADNSVPNCAKVCARSKTYAETWARIEIWQTASIRRFKVCDTPMTRSCATTCKPRFY